MSLKIMVKLGIPMMLQSSSVTISFLFVAGLVNQLGINVSAAFGIGQKLWSIPMILGNSVGQASTAMLGQNLGAKHYDRVHEIVRWTILLDGIIYGIFVILCNLFPTLSFRIFTQEEAILAYARDWALAMLIGGVAHTFMSAYFGLIQAVGDTKISMVIGIADAFLGRILLAAALGIWLHLGAVGFFIGYTAAAFLTSIPGFFYYKFVDWKHRGVGKMLESDEKETPVPAE